MKKERLIAGFHAVNTRLWHNPHSIYTLYLQEGKKNPRLEEIHQEAKKRGISIHFVSLERLDQLSKKVRHQGVVAFVDAQMPFVTIEDLIENLDHPPLLLILDEVTDPHNLGAALRVAEAMGVDAVIAPRNHSAGLSAVVSRVSAGAAEQIPYIMVNNLSRAMTYLKKKGVWLYGTAMQGGMSLFDSDIPYSLAWVMGAEGTGLRRLTRNNCDQLVYIPMYGTVESLNISVSAGIVLAETQRQYQRKKNPHS